MMVLGILHNGLFNICQLPCIYVCIYLGWWIAVQALGCAFLVFSIINLIIISVYVFRIKSNRKRSVSISHALCGVFTCKYIMLSIQAVFRNLNCGRTLFYYIIQDNKKYMYVNIPGLSCLHLVINE